jgi:hypothetical protein
MVDLDIRIDPCGRHIVTQAVVQVEQGPRRDFRGILTAIEDGPEAGALLLTFDDVPGVGEVRVRADEGTERRGFDLWVGADVEVQAEELADGSLRAIRLNVLTAPPTATPAATAEEPVPTDTSAPPSPTVAAVDTATEVSPGRP